MIKRSLRILGSEFAGGLFMMMTLFSILLVVVIGIGLYLKAAPILQEKGLFEILTTNAWRPGRGEFGLLPFIAGTLSVTLIAIVLALPLSLLTSLFLTEYSKKKLRKIVFTALDILAAIPSVVYGVWGTLFIVPWIADKLSPHFVEYSSGYSVLAGGIVLGIMVLPLLINLFTELFSSVPRELREASVSLGATRWQTCKFVVVKRTASGILAAIVLAFSRAFGETIAVLMVCGNLPIIPKSIFDAVYPLPALIANNYGEMLSIPLYESALMLAALILFAVVLVFNTGSRIVIYRIEKYYQ